MRQTTTYKLNLIETDDLFGPEALNANAEALETQLARVDAAAAAETARVDAALGTKAAQADLTALTQTVAANKSAAETALAAKADKTALTAEETARKSEVARLDAALVKFDCGVYTGDGSVNRKINVGFTPKLVYVGYEAIGRILVSTYSHHGGVALPGHPVESYPGKNYSQTYVEIVQNGFQVSHCITTSLSNAEQTANRSGETYRWFAFG